MKFIFNRGLSSNFSEKRKINDNQKLKSKGNFYKSLLLPFEFLSIGLLCCGKSLLSLWFYILIAGEKLLVRLCGNTENRPNQKTEDISSEPRNVQKQKHVITLVREAIT